MGKPPRKRRLSGEARPALELLSRSADGVNEALLLAHGFTRPAESEPMRPPIPTESGHPIRSKAATDSERSRPPVDGVKRGTLSAV